MRRPLPGSGAGRASSGMTAGLLRHKGLGPFFQRLFRMHRVKGLLSLSRIQLTSQLFPEQLLSARQERIDRIDIFAHDAADFRCGIVFIIVQVDHVPVFQRNASTASSTSR